MACLVGVSTLTLRTELWRVDAQDVMGDLNQQLDETVPPAALLTDRGRELAESLRNLRRTRDNLGEKHPTLPVIKRAIAETEKQLKAWLPIESGSDNPFNSRDSKPQQSTQDTVDGLENSEMNNKDLRQLVLSLHAKVEQLEERIRLLEKRNKRDVGVPR